MKKINKTPLAAAMGVAFISTFAASGANAEANPFGMSELSQGYMQLAEADKPAEPKAVEAKVVEKKCAGMMDGDKMKPGMESSCGAMMKGKEGMCGMMSSGEATKTDSTAKTGEMSCGGMMEDGKMKKGMESACGAMMKGKEGACGMMPMGDKAKEGACGAGKTEAAKPADVKTETAKPADTKAAEASCGGMMEDGKMKKGMESACGAMMKGKEGACGMMQDGDAMKAKEGSCGSGLKSPENKGTANLKKATGVKVIPYKPAAK
jgi:uncharacterized low-complexity protein